MKIEYDPDADGMYITLKEGSIEKTKKINDNLLVDYDKMGRVIGVEVLFLKERVFWYDQEADKLYLQFQKDEPWKNVKLAASITAEFAKNGSITTLEISHVKNAFPKNMKKLVAS